MLLYYQFWMFMDFTLHFYIVFGTYLLTRGLARIAIFLLIFYFAKYQYQTKSKCRETFWRFFLAIRDPGSFSYVGSKSPGSCSFQKSRSRRFHSVWTPFDILFLRNSEIGKKQQFWVGPPVSRLVPKII